MSHGVTETDKVFAAGRSTWHGLETLLPEKITAEEAMQIIAPWEVLRIPMMLVTGGQVESHVANVRSDNLAILGIVSKNYVVHQPREVMGFMDAIIGEAGAYYETGGTLFGGKRLWLAAKLDEYELCPTDRIQEYLVGYTSFGGDDNYHSTEVFWTSTRVVCNNTLTWARGSTQCRFKARHTSDLASYVPQAQDVLGFARQQHEETLETYSSLLNIYPSEEEVQETLERLFPEPEDAKRDTWTKPRKWVYDAYNERETCNIPGMEGTGWALYNAATEYSDWYHRPNRDPEKSWLSATEGTGMEFKEEALQAVLALR